MNNEEKWKQEFEEYIKKDIVFMNSNPEKEAYFEACKQRQSEIERLEKENTELFEEIKQLKKEGMAQLKKKDQIIEKAEKVIDEIILDIERCDRYFQSSGTKNQFQRKQESRKKQYFKDKDKSEV